MNKTELVAAIAEKAELSKKDSEKALKAFVDVVTEQLALINENTVIHRINGDAPRDLLIEPQWSIKKLVVMNEIDKEFVKRGTHQGFLVQNAQK